MVRGIRATIVVAIGLFFLCFPAFSQDATLSEDTARQKAEMDALLGQEAGRWGTRVQAGQGCGPALLLVQQAIQTRDYSFVEKAIAAAHAEGDAFGEGLVLVYSAMYAPMPDAQRLQRLEQSLPLLEGVGDPMLCARLHHLVGGVKLYYDDLDGAISHFRAGLTTLDSLGQAPDLAVDACLGLGMALSKRWRPREALPYAERALAAAEKIESPYKLARARLVLGGALLMLRRDDEAEALLRTARESYAAWKDETNLLNVDLFLAGLAEERGQVSGALKAFREIRERSAKMGKAWNVRECNLAIARALMKQGEFEASEQAYRAAFQAFVDAGDTLSAARTREQLAQMYLNHGRFRDAEALLLECLEVFSKSDSSGDLRRIQLGLATFYWNLGRLDDALGFYQRALAPVLGPEQTQKLATALRLWNEQKYDEALESYAALLESATFPEGDSSAVFLRLSLGDAYAGRGNYTAAVKHYQRVISTDDRVPATARLSLAGALLELGQPEEALKVLQEAARIIDDEGNRTFRLSLLQRLARTYARLEDPAKAQACLEEAVTLFDRLQMEGLYSGGLSSAVGMSRAFASLCGQLAEARLSRGDVEGAFLATERGRDRLLAVTQIRSQRSTSPAAATLRADLARKVQELSVAEGQAGAQPERLQKLGAECDALEAALLRATKSAPAKSPSIKEIQARLTEDDALLSLVVVDKTLHSFLLKRSGIFHASQSAPEKTYEALAVMLSTGGSGPALADGLKRAYTNLVQPFEGQLEGVTALAIIPDGPLQELPFEALIDSSGAFVASRFEVTYLTSAYQLEGSTTVQGRGEVFGAPTFGKAVAGHKEWPALAGAKAEAEIVGRHLGVKPWIGDQATEARFREVAPKARYLHVASHAFTSGQTGTRVVGHPFNVRSSGDSFVTDNARDPFLLSGILLAGANGSAADEQGILSAYDVLEMDLSNTELAVLSGCETGLGQDVAGEGLLGLRRAFQAAGVRNLITSLWAVDDEATVELMDQFYQRLVQGKSPRSALAEAKRELIGRGRAPSVWAAFVQLGSL